MIRRALSCRGFTHIDTASTAPATLALAGGRYDLTLVDVRLGAAQDGVDLVRGLRAAGFSGIVCMLTCDEEPGTILRALVAGADEYLLKRGDDLGRDVEEMLSPAEGERKERARQDVKALQRFLRSAGFIEYDSEIPCSGFDHCYKWFVWGVGELPDNATEIEGRGKSTNDYCDAYYDGSYAPPGHPWTGPNYTPICYDTGTYYMYYVHADDGFNGTDDYAAGDRMIRWDYKVGTQWRSTRVYYAGIWPQ
jgi:CheY-like chemotaxis protein